MVGHEPPEEAVSSNWQMLKRREKREIGQRVLSSGLRRERLLGQWSNRPWTTSYAYIGASVYVRSISFAVILSLMEHISMVTKSHSWKRNWVHQA